MFKEITKNGVVYLVSDIIKAPHAFSTRIGGVSIDSATSSMNFGSSVKDEFVWENIGLFTRAAGLDKKVIRAHQIHSSEIVTLFNQSDAENIDDEGFHKISCDGFMTDVKGISLCVRTADCLPIVMSNSEGDLVAVLHAGWRGSVAGIAGKAVMRFEERGVKPEDIFAALGPCISLCCFEVGADFEEAFLKSPSAHFANEVIEKRNGRRYCDLKKLNYLILRECGVPHENIDVSEYCTHHNPEMFFSHRRTGVNRGTMGAVCSVRG